MYVNNRGGSALECDLLDCVCFTLFTQHVVWTTSSLKLVLARVRHVQVVVTLDLPLEELPAPVKVATFASTPPTRLVHVTVSACANTALFDYTH